MTQAEIDRAAEEYANSTATPDRTPSPENRWFASRDGFVAGAEHAGAKWIKCSERLPERGETVLLFDFDDYTVMTFIEIGEFGPTWTDTGDVTSDSRQCFGDYWMPLPAAPEAESK